MVDLPAQLGEPDDLVPILTHRDLALPRHRVAAHQRRRQAEFQSGIPHHPDVRRDRSTPAHRGRDVQGLRLRALAGQRRTVVRRFLHLLRRRGIHPDGASTHSPSPSPLICVSLEAELRSTCCCASISLALDRTARSDVQVT